MYKINTMAATIRFMSKLNLKSLTNSVTKQLMYNGARTLYTDEALGLIDYNNYRGFVLNKYESSIEQFRTKLEKIVSDEKEIIFTEDLKALLHLVEKKPEDIELLKKLIKKYASQTSNIRFTSFRFGPVIMRALHYLNEPNIAKELFLNPEYEKLFDQLNSYMILLDLLYENKMYTDVRVIFNNIKEKYSSGERYPKLSSSIAIMACLKENTPESLESGIEIYNYLDARDRNPVRKFIAALSTLALKQNKPEMALELVAACRNPDYISIRSIRIMALAALNKIDDLVLDLKQTIHRGAPYRNQFYKDTFKFVEEAAERLQLDKNSEIFHLINILREQGYIYDMTLEEHISLPIEGSKRINSTNQFQGNFQNQREVDRQSGFSRNQPFQRKYEGNRASQTINNDRW